jgi:hypothetical protein
MTVEELSGMIILKERKVFEGVGYSVYGTPITANVRFHSKPTSWDEIVSPFSGQIEKVIAKEMFTFRGQDWITFLKNPLITIRGLSKKDNVIIFQGPKPYPRVFVKHEGYDYPRYIGIEV